MLSQLIYIEYYVYDGINAIGSIGGTLGMCIGFSFAGLISSLIKILQFTIIIVNGKFASRKEIKANSQNGLFNDEKGHINKDKPHEILHVKSYPTNDSYLDKKLYQKIEEKLEKAVDALVKVEEKVAKLENIKEKVDQLEEKLSRRIF